MIIRDNMPQGIPHKARARTLAEKLLGTLRKRIPWHLRHDRKDHGLALYGADVDDGWIDLRVNLSQGAFKGRQESRRSGAGYSPRVGGCSCLWTAGRWS